MSRTMKDSGILWIGEIPEGWKVKRLKQESVFINGFAFDSEDFKVDEGVRVIRIGDIGLRADFESCVRAITNPYILNPYRIENGDILIAMSGATTGKCCIVDEVEEAYINQRVGIIRSNLCKIIYYSLQTPYFMEFVNLNNAGSAQPNISSKAIGEFPILLPPLAEQHLIAAFLDKKCSEIDSLIELQEQMIEELKAYKQSVITEAVTKGLNPAAPMRDSGIEWIGDVPEEWEVKELKYSLDGLCDGTHGTFERVDNGELLLSAKNIGDRGIVLGDNESQISHEDYTRIISNGFPSKGDVLLCCVGSIGKCCIFNEEKPIAFQRSVAFLRHNKTMTSEYLMYLLKSNIMQAQYEMYARKSAQSGIYMGVINNFVIVAPHSINEQQAIADYLDKKCGEIDELITIKQQKIESLKEYKKSVIYEYVTGKREV